MSKQSELRSVLETVGVVIGSLVIGIVIIVTATKKYDSPKPADVIVEKEVQENVKSSDQGPLSFQNIKTIEDVYKKHSFIV